MHSESLKKCKRWLGLWEQKDERWRDSGSDGFIRGGGEEMPEVRSRFWSLTLRSEQFG